MKEYVSKQNLGLPQAVAGIIIVLLGYGLSGSLSYLWVAALVAVAVYLFNFDENVRKTLKQAFTVAALAHVFSFIIRILRTVLNWFGSSSSSSSSDYYSDFMEAWGSYGSSSGGGQKALDVLHKIVNIINDCGNIIIIAIFLVILLNVFKGRQATISLLDKVAEEKQTCPKCGTVVNSNSAFCTKCGANLK